jgi:hypothetical protein
MPIEKTATNFQRTLNDIFASVSAIAEAVVDEDARFQVEAEKSDDADYAEYSGIQEGHKYELLAEINLLYALLFKSADDIKAEQQPILDKWMTYRELPPPRPGHLRFEEVTPQGVTAQMAEIQRRREALQTHEEEVDRRAALLEGKR